ncbi:29293_t:CDS:2 [Gigaspora margarita]|uniref:29293_t:CDS:1 n=1 Tax=Gigaspora margarita TaxID=4874 RepID=A0ABN7UXC1_GIGMA|nr:29293_t:CDS:2 [Gigaspora margarita]
MSEIDQNIQKEEQISPEVEIEDHKQMENHVDQITKGEKQAKKVALKKFLTALSNTNNNQYENNRVYYHAAIPTLAVLDLSSNPFTWISQKVSGNFIPPHLFLHTANVVHNYMILAYGFNYQTSLLSNDIFLLDISNDSEYKWEYLLVRL